MPARDPTPLDLGRAAAVRLARTDWHVDGDPVAEPEPEAPAPPPAAPPPRAAALPLLPSRVAPAEPPPPPDRILEAMLFVGGPPLTPDAVAAAVRGLTPEQVRDAVGRLNQGYRAQNRAYTVQSRGGGYVLAVRPAFRGVREKLFGGPREARLGPPALDTLSLVAYRQPVTKADVDALRGADSGGPLRQLVRLGLVAVAARGAGGGRDVGYGTTPRFLTLFGLTSLDDLPRLADAPQSGDGQPSEDVV